MGSTTPHLISHGYVCRLAARVTMALLMTFFRYDYLVEAGAEFALLEFASRRCRHDAL